MPILDITGERFGRLVAKRYLRINSRYHAVWLWQCDCGTEFEDWGGKIRIGQKQSCGCLGKETRASNGRAHDKTGMGSAMNEVLREYKRGAISRGHSWDLEDLWFFAMVLGDCFYCGSAPSRVRRVGDGKRNVYESEPVNGVDRLDNRLGYTVENSVTCCQVCNRAKGAMPLEEFEDWISCLTQYRKA